MPRSRTRRVFGRLAALALLSCTALVPAATAESGDTLVARAKTKITAMLELQSAAWSRGDLDTFVSIYADQAQFLSSTGLTVGRDKVAARYKKRYPDAAAMGRLRLEIVDFVPFQEDGGQVIGASVVARWFLSYPEDADREDADGLTLLTFALGPAESGDEAGERRFEIVHDASM